MANVLFVVPGVIIGDMRKGIEFPRKGDKVYWDGKQWFADTIVHFPDGGLDIKGYEKFKFPFIRVQLQPKMHD